MIDLKSARADAERVRSALARRGADEDFDRLLALDQRRRDLLPRVDDLRGRRKPKSGGRPSASEIADARGAKAELERLEPQLAEIESTIAALLGRLPNLPDPSAPDGGTEDDAVVIRVHREPPTFAFEPVDSSTLAARHGGIDMERGARMAGSRFAYRLGDIALIELALYRFTLDRLGGKHSRLVGRAGQPGEAIWAPTRRAFAAIVSAGFMTGSEGKNDESTT